MATLRPAALNLIRLAGFSSIRAGLQTVMHGIRELLAMTMHKTEPEPCWNFESALHGVECRKVVIDKGSAYISKAFAKACSVLKLKQIRTRPSARNGPIRCRSRSPKRGTPGYPATCRSVTGSGSTQPSPADPPNSGSMSCSAGHRGGIQQLLPPLKQALSAGGNNRTNRERDQLVKTFATKRNQVSEDHG
jgi:hypothetical protein